MGPAGMTPARAAGMAPLYAGQRLPQHGYPGPPQTQQLPRQGLKRTYSSEVSGCPALSWGLVPTAPTSCHSPPQVYPAQQYLPGGQYMPGPGQHPAPSSYPAHRLPPQQSLGQSLPTSGAPGMHYKVRETAGSSRARPLPGPGSLACPLWKCILFLLLALGRPSVGPGYWPGPPGEDF